MTTTVPVPTAGPAPLSTVRRWASLAVLSISLFVVVMDMTVLNVALPDLTTSVGAGSVAQLWIVDVYALVLAALLIPVTSLGDRWGRRRMLMAGFVGFAVASSLVLFADSAGEVIALRAVLGVAGAAIMPSTLGLIRTVFPDARERALALSVWGATAAVGSAAGPLVGGALLEVFSWHSAFLVNVPIMVAGLIAGRLLLPESRSERPGRLDAAGVLLSVFGTTGVVFGIKHLGKNGPDVVGVGALAVGAVVLALFVHRCLRQTEPMLAVRLFTRPVFRAGVVAALSSSVALVTLLFVGSQWLQVVQGWSPLHAGVGLVPLAVGGVIVTPFAPALAARFGVRPVMTLGLAVLASGPLLLGLLPDPLHYAAVAVAFALTGLGTAVLGLGSALIMGSAPQHEAGSAAAIEEMSYEVGGVLGITLLGTLASLVYRAGLPADAAGAVTESVSGAAGTAFADVANTAYTQAFSTVGLVAGLVLVLAAVTVWRWLPRDVDLSAGH